MSFTTVKKFMQENNFTEDMLTEDEKVYAEVMDTFLGIRSRESYLQAKEQYKDKFPIFTGINNQVSGFFRGPETSDFIKKLGREKPTFTEQLSSYDGEKYFDGEHDRIKHKYTRDPDWMKKVGTMTLDEMNAMPYTPDVDLQQVKDLEQFLDVVYQKTDELFNRADEKYQNGTALRNHDAASLFLIMNHAQLNDDKELYREVYDTVKELETKFHEIKDWDKLKFPLLNITPSRNPIIPVEFKDNYFFSSIIRQAPIYQNFKLGTGLTLTDVAKNPHYITTENAKRNIVQGFEKTFKEKPGTPAYDKEIFDFLQYPNVDRIMASGIGPPMVMETFGLTLVSHLDKNLDSQTVMRKQDASDVVVSLHFVALAKQCHEIPVEKRLETLVNVANPIKNWQAAFGLTKAPQAKGVDITKSAQTLTNFVKDSTAPIEDRQKMMGAIERGLNAAYKKNTWFLQRWIGWGDAKQYKTAIADVKENRIGLAAPTMGENNPNKPKPAKQKVELGLNADKKQLSPDPVRKEAPAVTKNIDVNVPK